MAAVEQGRFGSVNPLKYTYTAISVVTWPMICVSPASTVMVNRGPEFPSGGLARQVPAAEGVANSGRGRILVISQGSIRFLRLDEVHLVVASDHPLNDLGEE